MNRAAPLNELGTATLRSQKKPLTRPRILPLYICLQISVHLIGNFYTFDSTKLYIGLQL